VKHPCILLNLRASSGIGMLQCVAVWCSMLQRVAVCCIVLLGNPLYTLLNSRPSSKIGMLQCIALFIGMLQCIALFGSVLQCVAAEPPLDLSQFRGKFGDRYVAMC